MSSLKNNAPCKNSKEPSPQKTFHAINYLSVYPNVELYKNTAVKTKKAMPLKT